MQALAVRFCLTWSGHKACSRLSLWTLVQAGHWNSSHFHPQSIRQELHSNCYTYVSATESRASQFIIFISVSIWLCKICTVCCEHFLLHIFVRRLWWIKAFTWSLCSDASGLLMYCKLYCNSRMTVLCVIYASRPYPQSFFLFLLTHF